MHRSRQVSAAAAVARAALQRLRRLRRIVAALDLLHESSTTRAGTLQSPPAPPRPGRPAPPAGGSVTSTSIPHPPWVPRTFLPDEGIASPPGNPGSFSPARLNASGAGRARLRHAEREDPRDGHPNAPADNHRPARHFTIPQARPTPHTAARRERAPAPTMATTTPGQRSRRKSTQKIPAALDIHLLRWFPRKHKGRHTRQTTRYGSFSTRRVCQRPSFCARATFSWPRSAPRGAVDSSGGERPSPLACRSRLV